jgi:hypothetical protein
MEETKKESIIISFLDKYYRVEDKIFLNKQNQQEWGFDITSELLIILGFDKEISVETFKKWAKDKGVDYEATKDSFGPRKLKATWSPELANELSLFHNIDAEAELTAMIAEQISQEIDAQILLDLKGQITETDFLNLVKCVGYEVSPTTYDPETFAPRKQFWSIKKHEIKHERQNNIHWQDWLRATGQNEQT